MYRYRSALQRCKQEHSVVWLTMVHRTRESLYSVNLSAGIGVNLSMNDRRPGIVHSQT